jgi:hypothetical protein
MGLIATVAALVLSLLIASAKSAYDTQRNGVLSLSADIIALDRTLEQYGPEAAEARALLRETVAHAYSRIWSGGSVQVRDLDPASVRTQAEAFFSAVLELRPHNDAQRLLRDRSLQLTEQAGHLRLLLFQQAGSAISLPIVAILASWIAALFLGFGLTSPFNATVVAAFLVGALSVSAAMFLIVELGDPFNGLLKVPGAPMQSVLARIGG